MRADFDIWITFLFDRSSSVGIAVVTLVRFLVPLLASWGKLV